MGYFEDVTGTSSESRATYQANKAAAGGQRLTQDVIDRTLNSRSPAQSAPSSGGGGGGGGANILNMIAQAAVAPVPVKQSSTLLGKRALTPPSGGSVLPTVQNSAAPVPRDRPKRFNEDRAFDDAVNKGMSVEQIAAGAAGAGAALIAKGVIDKLRSSKGNQSDITFTVDPNAKAPQHQGPRNIPGTDFIEGVPLDANDPANKQFDYFNQNTGSSSVAKRPNSQPATRKVEGSNNIVTRNGMVEGQPTLNKDVNAQFYEIFGLPMPTDPSATEPRLVPGDAPYRNAKETYVSPYPQSQIPNARGSQKQLGDADSPTYRENFGYNDISRRAQDIVDRMETYGDYDITKYMDVNADPAVARTVGAMLRNLM